MPTVEKTAETEKITADVEKAAADAQKAAVDAEKDLAAAQKTAESAATAQTAARSELVRARAALEEARNREAVKTPAAFAAVQVWKAAVAASEAAAETLKEADRRLEPVSVFVSKKEGRIFIRQDWKEVYEAPVTIRDPDRPLGTHVYIAVAAEPDGSAMRWSAISVPPESASDEDRSSRKRLEERSPSCRSPRPTLRVRRRRLARWTGSSCRRKRASAFPSSCGREHP